MFNLKILHLFDSFCELSEYFVVKMYVSTVFSCFEFDY